MKLSCLYQLFLLFAANVHADIAPNPNAYYVANIDGISQGPLFLRGGAEYAWEEDSEGFTVLPDTKRNYFYARQNTSTGDLIATSLPIRTKVNGVLVGSSPLSNGISRHERPSEVIRKKKCGEFCDKKNGHGRELRRLVSTTGTMKNLMVLFKFSDHANRIVPSSSDISKLMNHPGDGVTIAYDPLAPTGSVREHYLKSSYGQLTIDSVITEWVTISYSESYCAGGNSGLSSIIHTCLIDALSKVDSQVNFSQFDVNGDKWIDAIGFLHSGYGAEWGGTDSSGTSYTNRIWSHKWGLYNTWTSAEGVRVSSYHISPSVWATSGSSIGRIGVIAHETGHYLGLPDLYDGSGGSGIGSWSLMANSWGFDGSQYYPPPMDAWCKMTLGWVTPTVISPSSQLYTLGPQCQSTTVFKITTNFPQGEYLLLENRQKVCFYDSQMGGSYTGGLAIFHIDENQGSWTTEGYPGQSGWPGNGNHYRVAVVQADKQYYLEKGYNRGDYGDLYHPGDALRPSTSSTGPYPNSDSYATGKVVNVTGITISNITLSGGNISFVFTVAGSPTMTPISGPTSKPSRGPTKKPSLKPTARPSSKPSITPTKIPSSRPSRAPSMQPSVYPTIAPTAKPTGPTASPSAQPTVMPTAQPSSKPTYYPTAQPTGPTASPTAVPTVRPTVYPTATPTRRPSAKPSSKPSLKPVTKKPTPKRPTRKPSPRRPTRKPSNRRPTRRPSPRRPTRRPSRRPTRKPSRKPSRKPTRRPTRKPTLKPVREPTAVPSSSSLTTSLQIVLKTDYYGSETWFYVLDASDGYNNVLYSYDYLADDTLYPPFTAQVPKNHCYEVYIRDDGYDGMCCAYGQGYYEIWWGGTLFKHSKFESYSNYELSTVGQC